MPLDMQGRHGTNAPPPGVLLWACPACGAEQHGAIEQGCTACGNGTPGQHVGETTPAGKKPSTFASDMAAIGAPPPTDVETAWIAWSNPQRVPKDYADAALVFQAFKAGWEIAMSQQQTASSVLPLSGTAQSRTIRAALEFFREQILLNHPEEVTTGEWLSAEAVSILLKEYEG